MSEFKAGTKIVLNDRVYCGSSFIEKGVSGILLQDFNDFDEHPYVEFDVFPSSNLHDAHGLGEQGKCWSVNKKLLSIYNDYESSNRYKLKKAIKETGISSRKLSHFAVGNESFFYNQTGPARFKEYGDISSSKLDSMLVLLEVAKINLNAKITQDAFDEREKLDLVAKTVDENNVPVVDLVKEAKDALDIYSNDVDIGNSDQEGLDSYVEQLQSQAIEKRDYRLKKWLIVLIVFALLLAFYFFQK